MANVSSQRAAEKMMVGASTCILIGGLAIINDTMRDRFGGVFTGSASSELSSALRAAQEIVRESLQTVGYSTSEHSFMTVFAIAAVVLFVAMFRS